jgi:hypothetical protein
MCGHVTGILVPLMIYSQYTISRPHRFSLFVSKRSLGWLLPSHWARGTEFNKLAILSKITDGGSQDSLVSTLRCRSSPTGSPEARTLAYVMFVRHRFLCNRRLADRGLQAGALHPMQWQMRTSAYMSFPSDTPGKATGEGNERVFGSPNYQRPGRDSEGVSGTRAS